MNQTAQLASAPRAEEDALLVQRAKTGDEAALTLLIGRYAPFVRMRARRFVQGPLECEDLTQEGMIALLKAVRHYREDKSSSFKTFAAVCINNKLRNAVAVHWRGKNAPMRDYLSLSDEQEYVETLVADSQQVNPELLIIANEQAETRRQQINSLLSSFERQVLRFYLSSYSYEEMATQLGSSAKAIDNALQRVRRKLRAVFTKE